MYRTARACQEAILEIGSWKGKSTICLALGSRDGRKVPVYAVDPHLGTQEQEIWLDGRSSFGIFKENITRAGLGHIVMPLVKRSTEAATDWNKPISFLWIDGDHSYAAAKQDFELFVKWVVDGGIVAFHDSIRGDVPRVVCQCFGGGDFRGIGLIDSIAYATKQSSGKKGSRDRLILFLVANSHRLRRIAGAKRVKNLIQGVIARI